MTARSGPARSKVNLTVCGGPQDRRKQSTTFENGRNRSQWSTEVAKKWSKWLECVRACVCGGGRLQVQAVSKSGQRGRKQSNQSGLNGWEVRDGLQNPGAS